MVAFQRTPVALTIAGSDSGGEAGIQADLEVFKSLGLHGAAAITCVTAQNRLRVHAIEPCSARIVRQQIIAVLEGYAPIAAKTGMLYSAAIIRTVSETWSGRGIPLVIDPVLLSTSGSRLLQPGAMTALKELLPRAVLVTPNLPETEALIGERVRTPEEMRTAARQLHDQFGCAALVKGGHMTSTDEATDFFYDGQSELLLRAPLRKGVRLHGTGCRLSAAITGFLAKGSTLPRAVALGKQFITDWITAQGTTKNTKPRR